MKTQNELQKMNDQQLTFELACLVFGEDEVYAAKHGKVAITVDSGAKYYSINDWSWIMPLAVEHDVSQHRLKHHDTWNCYVGGFESFDESPQRAIAIRLVLKLQEVA